MSTQSLAVLVDGENISPDYAEEILQKASTLGKVSIRLVFGDFRRRNTPPWDTAVVKAFRYDLVHVHREFRGSNSADEALCNRARRLARRQSAEASSPRRPFRSWLLALVTSQSAKRVATALPRRRRGQMPPACLDLRPDHRHGSRRGST